MKETSKKSTKVMLICMVLLFALCGITGTAFAAVPYDNVDFKVTPAASVLAPGEKVTLSFYITPSPAFNTLGTLVYIEDDLGNVASIDNKTGPVTINGKVVATLAKAVKTDASADLSTTASCGKFGTFTSESVDGPNTGSPDGILFFTDEITIADDIDVSSLTIYFDVDPTTSPGAWKGAANGQMNTTDDRAKFTYTKAIISVAYPLTSGEDTCTFYDEIGNEITKAIPGSTVTVSANTPGTRQAFKEFTSVQVGSFSPNAQTSPATFTMPAEATTVTATYAQGYLVTYDGNGSNAGTAPADPKSPYLEGSDVTVLDEGDLERYGYTFKNWNTAADGSGDSYAADDTISAISEDTTLFAQWDLIVVPEPQIVDNKATFENAEAVPYVNPGYGPSRVQLVSADNVADDETVSFSAAPSEDVGKPSAASGYQTVKVIESLFEIEATPMTEGGFVELIIKAQIPAGLNAGNTLLRHYSATGWDSTPIKPSETTTLTVTADQPFTHQFTFHVTEFSPFALTNEIPPSKSSGGSSSQGSSTWLTNDTSSDPKVNPTPTPGQTPGPVETPGVKPIETPQGSSAKTPAPFVGILAGLGAAAAVFGLRRK